MALRKEDILFLMLAALTIFVFLWYVFGQSPSLEQGLLLSLLTLVVKNTGDIAAMKERLKNHMQEHK